MFKKLIIAVAALGILLAIAPPTQADSEMDFTLVNATGLPDQRDLRLPQRLDEWGENILNDVLANGNYATITFQPAADNIPSWDIMVTWDDDSPNTYWRGLKLAEIHKITLEVQPRQRRNLRVDRVTIG